MAVRIKLRNGDVLTCYNAEVSDITALKTDSIADDKQVFCCRTDPTERLDTVPPTETCFLVSDILTWGSASRTPDAPDNSGPGNPIGLPSININYNLLREYAPNL